MPVNGVIDGQPVEATTFNSAYITIDQKGVADGVATLDATGKIPTSQLPVELLEYKGQYDASTNTPALSDGGAGLEQGNVYEVSVAGTHDFGSGPIDLAVGDYIVYNGATWGVSSGSVSDINKIGNVTSVSEQDGQVLTYNSTTSKYENKNSQFEILEESTGAFTASFFTFHHIVSGQGNITATLPIPVSTDSGKSIKIQLKSDSFVSDAVTVDAGVRLINGLNTYIIESGWECITLTTDGVNWFIE